jgi:hypothetical protein
MPPVSNYGMNTRKITFGRAGNDIVVSNPDSQTAITSFVMETYSILSSTRRARLATRIFAS